MNADAAIDQLERALLAAEAADKRSDEAATRLALLVRELVDGCLLPATRTKLPAFLLNDTDDEVTRLRLAFFVRDLVETNEIPAGRLAFTRHLLAEWDASLAAAEAATAALDPDVQAVQSIPAPARHSTARRCGRCGRDRRVGQHSRCA